MKRYTWKYTQFSQFNESDTLLLVSGVHFGSNSTSGEIAVFSLQGWKILIYAINIGIVDKKKSEGFSHF
jgi:hypothetical protein